MIDQLWQLAMASPLSAFGYVVMLGGLIDVILLCIWCEWLFFTLRRDTKSLEGLAVRGLHGRPADKAEFDRNLRRRVRKPLQWLEIGERVPPVAGLVFTMSAFVLSLAAAGNQGEIVGSLGLAAGTTCLGGVSMLVAMIARIRLEFATETLKDAADYYFSPRGMDK